MVTKFEDLDLDKTYSYADYLTWKFQERVEIIKGKVFKMAMPSEKHQRVSGSLYAIFWNYLEGKQCRVYHPPFDVRLVKPPHLRKETDKSIYTVVQPDITIICNLNIVDDKGCHGAPDMLIEIISPESVRRDLKTKKEIYEFSGVQEYWVVYPLEQTVIVYQLNEHGKYEATEPYVPGDKVKVGIFNDLEVDLNRIFEVKY